MVHIQSSIVSNLVGFESPTNCVDSNLQCTFDGNALLGTELTHSNPHGGRIPCVLNATTPIIFSKPLDTTGYYNITLKLCGLFVSESNSVLQAVYSIHQVHNQNKN